MPTATTSRRKRKVKLSELNGSHQAATNGKANGQVDPAVAALLKPAVSVKLGIDLEGQDADRFELIALDRIVVGDVNPRQRFDEAKHKELVVSIQRQGVLQPILVRAIQGGRFEIVAGERRYRAAIAAGLATVPAIVRDLTQAQALEIALRENMDRDDLDPLEEALGFRRLLDAKKQTQDQLACHLGCSQAHVANRLRLLKLPNVWQRRLISGEITATQARALVPFAGHPAAVKSIDKTLKRWLDQEDWLYDSFDDALDCGVSDVSRTVFQQGGKPPSYSQDGIGYVPNVVPTDEQQAELKCFEFDGELITLDVKRYDELQAAHLAALKEKAAAKAKRKQQGKGKAKAAGGKRTAAEQKRLDEQQAAQFRRRLREVVADWYRYAIAETILDDVDDLVVLRLLLEYHQQCAEDLDELLDKWGEGKRGRKSSRLRGPNTWQQLMALSQGETWRIARQFVAGLFWRRTELPDADEAQGRAATAVNDHELPAIAAAVGIDLATWWEGDQLSLLSQRYWSIHNKAQLEALADELGVIVPGSKKNEYVEQLAATPGLRLPKELATLKLDK